MYSSTASVTEVSGPSARSTCGTGVGRPPAPVAQRPMEVVHMQGLLPNHLQGVSLVCSTVSSDQNSTEALEWNP